MKIKLFKFTESALSLTTSMFISTSDQIAPLIDREFVKGEIRTEVEREQKDEQKRKNSK